MLKTTKSTTVNGYSVIGGVNVVSLYANISQDGNDNISTSILDKDLFVANKSACRQDMNDFQDLVDQLVEEISSQSSQNE